MDQPSFRVTSRGVFDSAVAFPRAAISRERQVSQFELELYTEDLPGISYINGQPYPLRQGLFICGKPGHRRQSRLPVRCLYVHLTTRDGDLEALLRAMPDRCILPEFQGAEELFRLLAAFPDSDRLEDALLLCSTVTRLIALLSGMTRQPGRTVSPGHTRALTETEAYIRQNLSADLSLEALSERAGFSPSHFHRVFTARFGKPPHEYVLERRIDAARAALQTDSANLAELAAACGFSSQAHFSTQFKKAMGVSPGQYRRAMLSRLEV